MSGEFPAGATSSGSTVGRGLRWRAVGSLGAAFAWAWSAPLAGLAAAGVPLASYLAFPPRTAPVEHAAFSWPVFGLLSVPALGVAILLALAIVRADAAPSPPAHRRPFPWWGWLGLGLVAAGWLLAWSEDVSPGWRRQTFTPLWLGYVVVMNALAWRRTGRSPLTHRPAWLAALVLASAPFWWLFEHLNRFVENWYYTGTVATSDWSYFLLGTLPFSTVLPAVASTEAWIASFPRLSFRSLPSLPGHPALVWIALVLGTLSLAAVGVWPEELYPMLWVAPLLGLAGVQWLALGESRLTSLKRGEWALLVQPALAALVCGFFWELWNWGSAAQWHYSVPYVQRFHLFEMPLLGYAGYLPFGIECALVADLVARAVDCPKRSGLTTAERKEMV